MRNACLLLLAALAAAGEVDDWVEKLSATEARVRYEAARALRKARAGAALPALVDALKDADPAVRLEAARAVAAIGIDEARVPALVERLAQGDPALAPLLVEALGDAGPAAVEALRPLLAPAGDDAPRRLALRAVARAGRHGAPAVPAALDLVGHSDPATAREAGDVLRRCGPWAEEYVPDIVERLEFAKEERVRWVAARVLAAIGPAAREAIEPLRRLRVEGSEALQAAAAEALVRIDAFPEPEERHPALRAPAEADATAPERFRVRFETSRGPVVVEVRRAWAPHGADRLYNLVEIGYFDGLAFFRVVEGFIAQFGIHGDTRIHGAWSGATIPDDPVVESNRRGTLTFAKAGPDSRTTQLFFNLADNPGLDAQGFAPVGRVVEGLDVLDALYAGYGDMPAFGGQGPDPAVLSSLGAEYLRREFPRLDTIERATVRKE